jgi:hypothetical protein
MHRRLCCTEGEASRFPGDIGNDLPNHMDMGVTRVGPLSPTGATRKVAYNLMFKPVKSNFTECQKYSG